MNFRPLSKLAFVIGFFLTATGHGSRAEDTSQGNRFFRNLLPPPSESEILADLQTPNLPESAESLGWFISQWRKNHPGKSSGTIEYGGETISVKFLPGRLPDSFSIDYFDRYRPASIVPLRKHTHHPREGIGAPLGAERDNLERDPLEYHFPPEVITFPVTAVAEWQANRVLEIRLLSPLSNEMVRVGGTKKPLAADFTVSWAILTKKAQQLEKSALREAFRKMPTRAPELYLLEPYDPDKEPLLMIHGLIDTPLTWAELSNCLWAEPSIRSRYQIWHFLYNTSAPALYSGRILQEKLHEVRREFDPDQNDLAMRRTSVLTHSMGGIVGRRLISRPGDAFWDVAFTRPIESLDLTDDERSSLQNAFFWEPERHVRRIIFVAVPHRGSDYADNTIGKIGRVLVKPPVQFTEFYATISAKNPGAFTPLYAELGQGKLDSVHALSPSQPTLKILADLPLSHPVSVHTIIGDRGKEGPIEESHDGFVSYWSSHLDFADSEKIVPEGHGAFRGEAGFDEILRILNLP
ncbi:MAG: alpha/beta hydrolase [Verrucomicrobiota bacterium]